MEARREGRRGDAASALGRRWVGREEGRGGRPLGEAEARHVVAQEPRAALHPEVLVGDPLGRPKLVGLGLDEAKRARRAVGRVPPDIADAKRQELAEPEEPVVGHEAHGEHHAVQRVGRVRRRRQLEQDGHRARGRPPDRLLEEARQALAGERATEAVAPADG